MPVSSSEPSVDPLLSQVGAGAGAALLASPASLYLGSLMGTLSSNLVLAALPSVLSFVLLPPLAVVFAEWMVLRQLAPSSARFSPAIWVTTGAQLLVFLGAVMLGVDAQSFADVAVLSLVEAIVLPSAATLMMWPTKSQAPGGPGLLEQRRPVSPRPPVEAPSMLTVPLFRRAL
jgi:hypothetical protein